MIANALNTWLEKYGFEVRVREEMNTDFYWHETDNTISYSILAATENIEQWNRMLDSLGLNAIIDPFYTSFLHEVGHSLTFDLFDEDEIDEYFATVDLMRDEPSSFAEDIAWTYFNLPIEYAATWWAVEFINKREKAVRELVEMVRPLLLAFLPTISED